MDPDANWDEMVSLATDIVENRGERIFREETERLANLVLALNEWLAVGGFPPAKFRK